jgi:hypothetical protein
MMSFRKVFMSSLVVMLGSNFSVNTVLACSHNPSCGTTPPPKPKPVIIDVICNDNDTMVMTMTGDFSTFGTNDGSCACGLGLDTSVGILTAAKLVSEEASTKGDTILEFDVPTSDFEAATGQTGIQGLAGEASLSNPVPADEAVSFYFEIDVQDGKTCQEVKSEVKQKGLFTGKLNPSQPANIIHLNTCGSPPLFIDLEEFTATLIGNQNNRAVSLQWKTISERNNTTGFNIWRATVTEVEKITGTTIPATGGIDKEAEYSYVDNTVPTTGSYIYVLEEVGSGNQTHFYLDQLQPVIIPTGD